MKYNKIILTVAGLLILVGVVISVLAIFMALPRRKTVHYRHKPRTVVFQKSIFLLLWAMCVLFPPIPTK